jgi:hypothetical protein
LAVVAVSWESTAASDLNARSLFCRINEQASGFRESDSPSRSCCSIVGFEEGSLMHYARLVIANKSRNFKNINSFKIDHFERSSSEGRMNSALVVMSVSRNFCAYGNARLKPGCLPLYKPKLKLFSAHI